MKVVSLLSLILPVFASQLVYGQPSGSVTQGAGTTVVSDLMPNCPSNHVTPLGTIISTDNKTWDVPAPNNFANGPYLSDLYNQCNSFTPANLSAVNLNSVPATIVDAGGDTVTAFLFCDNYFELYINGVLIGVDAVPFTPFNSSVAKFIVSQPYTIAVKLVDWEENLGLGSEIQQTDSFHPGDGGFIAQFSDGTVTGPDWKTQSFYIAPVQNLNDIQELPNGVHSSASATTTPTCDANCYGVHYDIPGNWNAIGFNDSIWPDAFTYLANQVTNQPAYTNFANTAWGNASFIWSSNLILDNLVLTRKTVGFTSGVHEVMNPEPVKVKTVFSNSIDISSFADMREVEINLSDVSGKIVSSWHRPAFYKGERIVLSGLADLPYGIYFLRIQSPSVSVSRKVIHAE